MTDLKALKAWGEFADSLDWYVEERIDVERNQLLDWNRVDIARDRFDAALNALIEEACRGRIDAESVLSIVHTLRDRNREHPAAAPSGLRTCITCDPSKEPWPCTAEVAAGDLIDLIKAAQQEPKEVTSCISLSALSAT